MPPVATKAPEVGRSPVTAQPALAQPSESNKSAKNLQTALVSPPARVPAQPVASETSANLATAKADVLPEIRSSPMPSATPPVKQTQSAESRAWDRAIKSRVAVDMMAYLVKFPRGEHADEAQKLLGNVQRTSEGCALRYPLERGFTWSGKCSDGTADGIGTLKWATRNGAASTIEGQGAFNKGILVGRWTFNFAFTAPAKNPIVKRVIDFDSAGLVSKQQRITRQDGGQYDGETNATMDKYFGAPHGEGSYTDASGGVYRGAYVDGKVAPANPKASAAQKATTSNKSARDSEKASQARNFYETKGGVRLVPDANR